MKFINEWKSKAKQSDKVVLEVRFGKFTLLNLRVDTSKKKLKLTVLNFTIKN